MSANQKPYKIDVKTFLNFLRDEMRGTTRPLGVERFFEKAARRCRYPGKFKAMRDTARRLLSSDKHMAHVRDEERARMLFATSTPVTRSFRQILDSMPNTTVEYDKKQRITLFQSQAVRLQGDHSGNHPATVSDYLSSRPADSTLSNSASSSRSRDASNQNAPERRRGDQGQQGIHQELVNPNTFYSVRSFLEVFLVFVDTLPPSENRLLMLQGIQQKMTETSLDQFQSSRLSTKVDEVLDLLRKYSTNNTVHDVKLKPLLSLLSGYVGRLDSLHEQQEEVRAMKDSASPLFIKLEQLVQFIYTVLMMC